MVVLSLMVALVVGDGVIVVVVVRGVFGGVAAVVVCCGCWYRGFCFCWCLLLLLLLLLLSGVCAVVSCFFFFVGMLFSGITF